MRCEKGEEYVKPHKRKKKHGKRKCVEIPGYCRKKKEKK